MEVILTFVSSRSKNPLTRDHLKDALKIMAFYNIEQRRKPVWLSRKKAVDIPISGKPGIALLTHLRELLDPDEIDLFVTAEENRKKKLLLADMDSTIVAAETLDELADHAGLKDEISLITKAAMEGQIDFEQALRQRVRLLRGLDKDALQKTLERMTLSEGALTFTKTMARYGATCVLVSGGFTFFTGAIAEQTGFHQHHGNILEFDGSVLSGGVTPPILDKHAKLSLLNTCLQDLKLSPQESLAIGDGANDIPMLKAAGLGVGYRPKPAVADAVPNLIRYGDLTAGLYAQGYKDKEFYRP